MLWLGHTGCQNTRGDESSHSRHQLKWFLMEDEMYLFSHGNLLQILRVHTHWGYTTNMNPTKVLCGDYQEYWSCDFKQTLWLNLLISSQHQNSVWRDGGSGNPYRHLNNNVTVVQSHIMCYNWTTMRRIVILIWCAQYGPAFPQKKLAPWSHCFIFNSPC